MKQRPTQHMGGGVGSGSTPRHTGLWNTVDHCGIPLNACNAEAYIADTGQVLHSDPQSYGRLWITLKYCGYKHLQLSDPQIHTITTTQENFLSFQESYSETGADLCFHNGVAQIVWICGSLRHNTLQPQCFKVIHRRSYLCGSLWSQQGSPIHSPTVTSKQPPFIEAAHMNHPPIHPTPHSKEHTTMHNTDTPADFVQSFIELSPGANLSCTRLSRAYIQYLESLGQYSNKYSVTCLNRYLAAKGYKRTRLRINGVPTRCYCGIRLRDNHQELPPAPTTALADEFITYILDTADPATALACESLEDAWRIWLNAVGLSPYTPTHNLYLALGALGHTSITIQDPIGLQHGVLGIRLMPATCEELRGKDPEYRFIFGHLASAPEDLRHVTLSALTSAWGAFLRAEELSPTLFTVESLLHRLETEGWPVIDISRGDSPAVPGFEGMVILHRRLS